ncbi:helix-turn-helix domain-containing protein [Liquorilactobacillus nagelii]|uniref:helix-turn-helix domain-containing protein n=1 Tax=Liquorilactobacillus nagelii TaxID=82688 RepID=UPI0006EEBD77|nr:helix-turn-helix domain-containing protein [Liquorilactobacillus nagelii]KRL41510.1 hypothetical protein FD45_GL001029 [Liquorilactobacillus nagelii DSM 13675]QYH54158.1 helix-turn-helix domain-containing protein [Liquorilactobacillus nagelii DSM 13675]
MKKSKKLYNPELETTENYNEIWKPEVIKVKDESDLLVMNHYWQDKNGELWGDFNDPMENVRRGFNAYRKRKGYMTPENIRKLREKLNLSVREFAKLLGIGASSLTQIENNQRIQVKYQDVLFKSIEENYHYQKKLPDILQAMSDHSVSNKFDTHAYVSDSTFYNTLQLCEDNMFFNDKTLGVVA